MLLSKPASWKFLIACLLAVGLLLPMAVTAQAASATITDVTVTDGTGTLTIDVRATGPVHHRSKAVNQPHSMLIVDLWPAALSDKVQTSVEVNRGLVTSVRVAQYTGDTVRLYVDVVSHPVYRVTAAPGNRGLTMAIETAQMAEAKVSQAPAVAAKTAEPAPAPPAAAPAPAPRPKAAPPSRAAAPAPAPLVLAATGPRASALRARKPPARAPKPRVKRVTLDFVNADLVYVIKVLAKEMGKNVFIAPDISGAVTVTLKDVPVEGALALILKMQESDVGYKVVDDTIIVATPEKLDTIPDDILQTVKAPTVPEEAVRQEFLLENAPAAKVMEFLQGQYPNVAFTAHPTMNGFYARGSKEDLLQIKRDLPNLDRVKEPPPPPRREFLPVKYGDLKEVQSLLKTLVPDLQYNTDTHLNMLIVEGSESAIDQAKELLAELDRPLEQVMLDVKVLDLTESGSKSLGITWGTPQAPGTFTTTFTETAVGGTVGSSTDNSINALQFTGLPIAPFARSPFVIQSTLAFLVQNGQGKILASPRVAAQSGTQALIHVGDKFPIVYFDPRAGQFQVTYVDIGIKFNCKPEVKTDGYVVAAIQPEVSNLLALVNNQYPRTAIRTVNTTMRIKDGDTVVIGGLLREEETTTVSKIPLLGDLPILGSLFRQQNTTSNRNEVVLMFTPHIMR